MPDVVEVVQTVGTVVEVLGTGVAVVEIPAVVGPRGPAGSGALVVDFPIAQGSWTYVHNLGRRPASITLYMADGAPVDAPTFATDTLVAVTWPFPVAGSMILT